jgi:hypothetical protein
MWSAFAKKSRSIRAARLPNPTFRPLLERLETRSLLSTTLVASPSFTTGGELATFTATISPSPGDLGTVTFIDNGVTLAENVSVANGVAVFQTPFLSGGTHLIQANFNGALGHPASSSNTVQFVALSRWTAAADMPVAGVWRGAVKLTDGRVLVAGGLSQNSQTGQPLVDTAIYDPVNGTWSTVGPMNNPRGIFNPILLNDGKVLVAGGGVPTGGGIASAELFDPSTNQWSEMSSMSNQRYQNAATRLSDGRVLVVGGSSGGNALSSAEIYDPLTNTWSDAGSMSVPRNFPSAILLPSGKVLVAGGSSSTSSTELYDPITNTWTDAAPMSVSRVWSTAIFLASGKVLISGGSGLSSAELYDPLTNTWTGAGSMLTARAYFPATLLDNGQVLVCGGRGPVAGGGEGPISQAELYDPVANTWSNAGSMSIPRGALPTATLLNDGTVLVAGGNTFATSSPANLFSTATAEIYHVAGAAPTIVSIAPFSGPTTGGSTVVITGTNFVTSALVKFGGNAATNVVVNSSTQITAVSPPGTGTVDVTVQTAFGSGLLSNAYQYVQAAAPQLTNMVVNGGPMFTVDSLGGSPTGLSGHNSVVEQLAVNFDIGVTVGAGAFTLDALAVNETVATSVHPVPAGSNVVPIVAEPDPSALDSNGGYKRYRLRFLSNSYTNTFDNTATGTGGIGNISTALKDGVYRLNVIGANIHAGSTLDGTPMASNAGRGIWALYGSGDPSDRTISSSFLNTGVPDGTSTISTNASVVGFVAAFGSERTVAPSAYSEIYDWNLDGSVSDDILEFARRFGAEWRF